MTMKHLLLVSALILPLSGCVVAVNGSKEARFNEADWRQTQKANRSYINQLTTGTSLVQVMQDLGAPDFTEAFQQGDSSVQVLFYRTHHRRSDGMTTKDECTPLVFSNGRLSGWGEKAYAQL